MARRAAFGHLPRQVPSLSATVVSIAREMQQLYDQNYVTAWEKGGEVDGVKVTDEMLLQHLRERRANVSENDPLWDYYNNLLQNYEFSIAESKMTLRYAQHSVGESAMAKFYSDWAAKLPPDSEAYRNLMRSAAQYVDLAASRGRAASSAAKQAAYARDMQNNYDVNERKYDTTTMYLAAALVRGGVLTEAEYRQVINGIDGSGGASIADLLSTGELDQAALDGVLLRFNNDPEFADLRAGWQKEAGTTGGLTYDQWIAFAQGKQTGLDNRVGISTRYGDKDGAEKAKTAVRGFTRTLLASEDIDVVAQYSREKARFENALTDLSLTSQQRIDLADDFRATLQTLLGQAESDWTKSALEKEIGALEGNVTGVKDKTGEVVGAHLSLSESATGATTAEVPKQGSDLAGTAEMVRQAKAEQALFDSGKGVYVPNPNAGKAGQPPYLVAENTGPVDPSQGIVTSITVGGRTYPVVAPVHPIVVKGTTAVDPNTGRPTSSVPIMTGKDAGIGYYATLPDGRTVYGILHDSGRIKWYTTNPFDIKEGGNVATPIIESDGQMTVIVRSSGGAVDPMTAVAANYRTPNLMNSAAFDDPAVALAVGEFNIPPTGNSITVSSSPGRWDLANANTEDMAHYYQGTYGSQSMLDPADPAGKTQIKVSDYLTTQFKDAQVTAAALIRNPNLLLQSAAAGVGEKFWEDYDVGKFQKMAGGYRIGDLLAQTPAAQGALKLEQAKAEQAAQYANVPGYKAAAAASATGVVEVVSEEVARQRAMDLLRQTYGPTGNPFAPVKPGFDPTKAGAATEAVRNAPAIKLPQVLSDVLGTSQPWIVAPPQASPQRMFMGSPMAPSLTMTPPTAAPPPLVREPGAPHQTPPETPAITLPPLPRYERLTEGPFKGKQLPV